MELAKLQKREQPRSVDEIRHDYLNRYLLARELQNDFGEFSSAADLGAGFGWGSWVLAEWVRIPKVIAYDFDESVIPFAEQYWGHPNVERRVLNLERHLPQGADLMVAVEFLEHIRSPERLLTEIANGLAWYLIGSVPNQDLVPFDPAIHKWHTQHYTPEELLSMLERTGLNVLALGCQTGKVGKKAEINWSHTNGRTLVFKASAA